MRAIVLSEFGGPERLELRDVPAPHPDPGEVGVAIAYAALNRRDWWLRRGSAPRDALPAILGSDAAGKVAVLGEGVEDLNVGQEVVVNPALHWGEREDRCGKNFEILGVPSPGTYAERVCVPAQNVRPRPQRLSWQEAAALPLVALTAWRALVTHGEVGEGTRVLIPGAGSGLACTAVSIAAELGARVYVTSSSAEKIDRAIELGAIAGFDYRDSEWSVRVREASGGIDVVVDGVGAAVWPGALRSLATGGRLVSVGDLGGDTGEVDIPTMYFGHHRIQGSTMGSPREFDAMLTHVEGASWRPLVDSVFPLAETASAHERLDAPDRLGKVVLEVVGEDAA